MAPGVATATVREDSSMVVVPRPAVTAVMRDQPSVTASLLASLTALVRRVDEQVSDLALLGLPRRVEKFIVAAARAQHPHGPQRPGGAMPVDLRINQTDLAHQVGGSRQQVNRILMALEATGSIERFGHRIVAVRPDLLAQED